MDIIYIMKSHNKLINEQMRETNIHEKKTGFN
jgi:hypothetical protein